MWTLFRPVVVLAACGAFGGCKASEPEAVSLPFFDDFEREGLGDAWRWTGGHWAIDRGAVFTTGANNAPLFLKAALPNDVVIEVDITSETSAVDAKIELMTDGRTHQSGYIFILGGWSNKLSAIARLDEHGRDRKVKKPTNAVGRKTYRWRIEKKGGDIRWYLDGQLYMTYSDAHPLEGPGHDRLAFSNWQNQLRYDNLKVWAYDDAPAPSTPARAAPATAPKTGKATPATVDDPASASPPALTATSAASRADQE